MSTIPVPFITAVRALLAAGWKDNLHRHAWAPKSAHRTRILRRDDEQLNWYPLDFDAGWRIVYVSARRLDFEHEPASLTEAIDVLVALGVLEARHSSAYVAGKLHAFQGVAKVYAEAVSVS